MDTTLFVLCGIGLIAIGCLIPMLVMYGRLRRQVLDERGVDVDTARREAQRILGRAEDEGRARAEAYREREEALLEHRKLEVGASEERLIQRERTLEQRASNLAQREQMLLHREAGVSELRADLEESAETARANLERISALDARAAREELVEQVRDEARREAMLLVRDSEMRAREEADRRARHILVTAIERLSTEVVMESTVSAVPIPRGRR